MRSLSILQKKKDRRQKSIALTAYDFQTADWLAECPVDFLLVGDSLANVIAGYPSTLPVTMEDMLYHTRMTVRGARTIPVVADMPFLSYELDPLDAARNAGRFIKETGASGVKIEGGADILPSVRKMIAAHIPVMGHVGLKPQSVLQLGGYKIQGTSADAVQQIKAEALAFQEAGVFAVVVECVPRSVAKMLTDLLAVPTIGIGAGPDCDGQILVTHDLLGWDPQPKTFVKPYADFRAAAQSAVRAFAADVENGRFPDDDHSF